MVSKSIYVVSVGLVGSIIVHLIIIFLLPGLSANSTWLLVTETTDVGIPKQIDSSIAEKNQNLFLDPMFEVAACRFDLSEGVMRITANGETLLWTVAVFDPSGTAIFSANDRIANSRNVDIAIVNKSQLRFARQNTPDELSQSIIASVEQNEGYALLRVFTPDQSWKSNTKEFLDSMRCEFLAF